MFNHNVTSDSATSAVRRASAAIHETRSAMERRLAVLYEVYAREARRTLLPADWQPEVTWSIVLEVYRARRDYETPSVKAVQLASGAPSSTVIRHIDRLVADGWMIRSRNPEDTRVTNLDLTVDGFGAVEKWADQAFSNIRSLM